MIRTEKLEMWARWKNWGYV